MKDFPKTDAATSSGYQSKIVLNLSEHFVKALTSLWIGHLTLQPASTPLHELGPT